MMHSKYVQEAQYLLSRNRWNKNFEPGAIDGYYGPQTGAAAHRAKYYLGYPTSEEDTTFGRLLYGLLVQSGAPGYTRLGATYALRKSLRARHVASETVRDKAVATAMSQVGYAPGECSKYGAWYGMPCSPWCAMFVSWCFAQNHGPFRYSYVPNIVSDARSHRNNLAAVSNPILGDLVCYDWNHDGIGDHVEFFRGWTNSDHNVLNAVGGNTGSVNFTNGGEVLAQERSATLVQQFVRVYSV